MSAGEYTQAVAKAAEENQDFVMGFISIAPSAWKDGPGSPGMLFLLLIAKGQGCELLWVSCDWRDGHG